MKVSICVVTADISDGTASVSVPEIFMKDKMVVAGIAATVLKFARHNGVTDAMIAEMSPTGKPTVMLVPQSEVLGDA